MEELTYYLEWKNELKYSNSAYEKTVNHLRPGVKFKNFYWEGGYVSDGKFGAETGYKFQFDSLTVKGKWEGISSNDDTLKHKLETEVRFTF